MDYNHYQDENRNIIPTDPPTVRKKKRKSGTALSVVCVLIAVVVVGMGSGFVGSHIYGMLAGEGVSITQSEGGGLSLTPTSVDRDSTTELSVSAIADITQPSVVEITTEVVSYGQFNQSYVGSGAGSGVIITQDGYIVTNHHVIDGASSITVTTINGEQYSAELIGSDAQTDLAVLKIQAEGLYAATIGHSSELEVGDYVMAIGNPLGELGGTVSDGIVSATSREVIIEDQTMTLLQTNAAINPGNSGGGLFNENGELIAIVNAKFAGEDIEGIGFAIPIDIAVGVIEDLIDVGYVQGRFTFGVGLVEVADERMAMMYRVDNLGVYVQSVTQNGNAHMAGVQVADRIVMFEDVEITTYAQLETELQNCEANQTVSMVVERNGELIDIDVVLYETQGENAISLNS